MNRPPHDWLPAVMTLLQREPAVVRVVVADARGSVPREPGAFMLVSRCGVEGTVGGGRLEWECIAAARALLDDASAAARLSKIVLAADVGQCCGGVVSVWLDRFMREDLGLLALARDAGVRGVAVLSTSIRGALAERRLVDGDGAADAAARAGGDACGAVSAVAAADSDAARAGVGAVSVLESGDVGADAAAELLRMPRLRAGPQVVREASGEVTFLERLDDALPALWLYGAGHVGQALARILGELPMRLTWVDSRAELFPAALDSQVRLRSESDSVATVSDALAGAYFLVMTHSHSLDYELCRAILRRNDFAWLGLIGSESKAARFRSRLARDGVGADRIGRLVCPIGVSGIESKWPAAIAVGVAAQLMQEMSAAATAEREVGRTAALPPAREMSLPGAVSAVRAREVSSPGPLSAAQTRETSLAEAGGLGEGALPLGDCGQESCSSCGTRRRLLE